MFGCSKLPLLADERDQQAPQHKRRPQPKPGGRPGVFPVAKPCKLDPCRAVFQNRGLEADACQALEQPLDPAARLVFARPKADSGWEAPQKTSPASKGVSRSICDWMIDRRSRSAAMGSVISRRRISCSGSRRMTGSDAARSICGRERSSGAAILIRPDLRSNICPVAGMAASGSWLAFQRSMMMASLPEKRRNQPGKSGLSWRRHQASKPPRPVPEKNPVALPPAVNLPISPRAISARPWSRRG